jgi:hypothetical protein
MKIVKVISCHNRVDDLLLNLETYKYWPFDLPIIIVHTMDYSDYHIGEIKKHTNHLVRIEGYGHYIGPLLCAVAGVRKANELGFDYLEFSNADDIVYNYNFEKNNFNLMEEKGYLCAGYSWMGVNSDKDITLNQLYMNVKAFSETVDDAESYFLRSGRGFICEYKMSRWVKRTLKNLNTQFYRLPDREQIPGIGWEEKDLPGAFEAFGIKIPDNYWEALEENNRFFNRKWQLIGSHDNESRLSYWRKIRSEIPYSHKIEKDYHFSRWIEATREKKPWNLKTEDDPAPLRKVYKTANSIKRKIFL